MKSKAFEFQKYRAEFERTFNRDLFRYACRLTGFQICTFDEDLGVPDGTSTKDFILQKFGKDAVALVENLIKI